MLTSIKAAHTLNRLITILVLSSLLNLKFTNSLALPLDDIDSSSSDSAEAAINNSATETQPQQSGLKLSQNQLQALLNTSHDEMPRLTPTIDLLLAALIYVSNIKDVPGIETYHKPGSRDFTKVEQVTMFMAIIRSIVHMYEKPEIYQGPVIDNPREAILTMEPHRRLHQNPTKMFDDLLNQIAEGKVPKSQVIEPANFSNDFARVLVTAFRAASEEFTESAILNVVKGSAQRESSDALLNGVVSSLLSILTNKAFAEIFSDVISKFRKYRADKLRQELEQTLSELDKTSGETKIENRIELENRIRNFERQIRPELSKMQDAMEYVSPEEKELLLKNPAELSSKQKKRVADLIERLRYEQEFLDSEKSEEKSSPLKPQNVLRKAGQAVDEIDRGLDIVEQGFRHLNSWNNLLFELSSNPEYFMFLLKALAEQDLVEARAGRNFDTTHFRRISALIETFEAQLNEKILPALSKVGEIVAAQLNERVGEKSSNNSYLINVAKILFEHYIKMLPPTKRKDILIDILREAVQPRAGADTFEKSLAIITYHFGPAMKQFLQIIADQNVGSKLSAIFKRLQQHGKVLHWDSIIKDLQVSSPREYKKLMNIVYGNPGYGTKAGKAVQGFSGQLLDPTSGEVKDVFFRVMRSDFYEDLTMDKEILDRLIPELVKIFVDSSGRGSNPAKLQRMISGLVTTLYEEGDLVQTHRNQEIGAQRMNHTIELQTQAGKFVVEFYVPKSYPVEAGDRVHIMEQLNPIDPKRTRNLETALHAESMAIYQASLIELFRPTMPQEANRLHQVENAEAANLKNGFMHVDLHGGNRMLLSVEHRGDHTYVKVGVLDFGLVLSDELTANRLKNITRLIVGCSLSDQKLIVEALWRMRNPDMDGKSLDGANSQSKESLARGVSNLYKQLGSTRNRFYTPSEVVSFLDSNHIIEFQSWLVILQRSFTILQSTLHNHDGSIGGQTAEKSLESLNLEMGMKFGRGLLKEALNIRPIVSASFPYFHPSNIWGNLKLRFGMWYLGKSTSNSSNLGNNCKRAFDYD